MIGAGGTICAIASAPGRSARAVIRASGPDVARLVSEWMIDRATGRPPTMARGARAVGLRVGGPAPAPALAVFFAAPRSYTGEDAVEAQLPGNPALVERALGAALAVEGVRLAAPGEFTARAFFNGRITVEQAEGVAMIIAAASEAQRAAAAELMAGRTGARHRALASTLADALALVEAGVDFTDQEDVTPIAPGELFARLGRARAEAGALLGSESGGSRAEGRPVVALAGAPNAGKSTLFNALLGRRRAVVSEEAGATRDAIAETLDLARDVGGAAFGVREVTLVDLAGLDEALARHSRADDAAQRAARRAIDEADAIVLCDPSGRFETPAWIPPSTSVVRVRTKADLPHAGGMTGEAALAVCALDGWNLAALRRAIADAAQASRGAEELTVLPRHRRALAETARWLDEALAGAERSRAGARLESAEVVAGAMRAALDAIGEIAGRVPPDDVIGRIFASFCVGK